MNFNKKLNVVFYIHCYRDYTLPLQTKSVYKTNPIFFQKTLEYVLYGSSSFMNILFSVAREILLRQYNTMFSGRRGGFSTDSINYVYLFILSLFWTSLKSTI